MNSFGDVLIINFPFSNGQGSKRRPVFVISDTNDGDLLVAKITSQLYNTRFDVSLQDWKQANLLSPSVVRIHKIQTIHAQLVFGQIGRITNADARAVKNGLLELMRTL